MKDYFYVSEGFQIKAGEFFSEAKLFSAKTKYLRDILKKRGIEPFMDLKQTICLNQFGGVEKMCLSGRSICSSHKLFLEGKELEKTPFKNLLLTSLEDYDKIHKWNELIATKRKMIITSCKEFTENLEKYSKIFGHHRIFIEGRHFKGATFFIIPNPKDSRLFLFPTQFQKEDIANLLMSNIYANELITISSAVQMTFDEHVNRQWGVKVVNGEIVSVKRVSDISKTFFQREFEQIIGLENYSERNSEPEILRKIKRRIDSYQKVLPKSYKIMFFEFIKNGRKFFDVVRVRPIIKVRVSII